MIYIIIYKRVQRPSEKTSRLGAGMCKPAMIPEIILKTKGKQYGDSDYRCFGWIRQSNVPRLYRDRF